VDIGERGRGALTRAPLLICGVGVRDIIARGGVAIGVGWGSHACADSRRTAPACGLWLLALTAPPRDRQQPQPTCGQVGRGWWPVRVLAPAPVLAYMQIFAYYRQGVAPCNRLARINLIGRFAPQAAQISRPAGRA
jgi:hypothetical protein